MVDIDNDIDEVNFDINEFSAILEEKEEEIPQVSSRQEMIEALGGDLPLNS